MSDGVFVDAGGDQPTAAAAMLHFTEHGLAPGPDVDTLVLLHGFGATSYTWDAWLPDLSRRAHVVTIDLKGFGRSAKPDDGRYGPLDQADLVYALIRAQGWQRVTLVGHSLGGGVALLTALRLRDSGPELLHRLVVVAGAAYPQRLPPFVALGRRPRLSATLLRWIGPKNVIRTVLRTIVYEPSKVTSAQVDAYATPLLEEDGARALLDAARQIVPPDLEGITTRYGGLNVPALVLWGRHDRVVPLWVGERLAHDLPDARLVILERCGHVPSEELPSESLATVVAFLDAT